MTGVLLIFAWRQAKALAQASRPHTSFLTPSVLLPPSCGARAGGQNPETHLKKPFLSTAVVTDISSVHLSLESSRTHVLADGSVCKQAENVLLEPHRYFRPWKIRACFLALSSTARQWRGGPVPAATVTAPAPPGCSELRAEFIPSARPLRSPDEPRCHTWVSE